MIHSRRVKLVFVTAVIGSTLCGQNQTPANPPSPESQYLGAWHGETGQINDLKVEQAASSLVATYSLGSSLGTLTVNLDLSRRGSLLLGSLRSGACSSDGRRGTVVRTLTETFTATLEGNRLKVDFEAACPDDSNQYHIIEWTGYLTK
jgi:hypothetical protein